MANNGRLPDSDLEAIPGGRLRKDAADSWLAMRTYIGKRKGVWICPTSTRTAYRPFADQEYFWNLYRSGRGALAARPGTSNHGWGIAVDLPSPAMQAAVRECGHMFGWGIRGGRLASDAPSEPWHCTYHSGTYAAVKQNEPKPKVNPYKALTDREKHWRDVLLKQRRIARRHGGWREVDPSHLRMAVEAKKKLRAKMRKIAKNAEQSGWEKAHRRVRYDYMKKLVQG
jgi:D-alanyl-D-alanine carboxypeptidase